MAPISAPSQAAYAYDVLAPYYDDFTAGYAYERWMRRSRTGRQPSG
jgi:hypothetical protein